MSREPGKLVAINSTMLAGNVFGTFSTTFISRLEGENYKVAIEVFGGGENLRTLNSIKIAGDSEASICLLPISPSRIYASEMLYEHLSRDKAFPDIVVVNGNRMDNRVPFELRESDRYFNFAEDPENAYGRLGGLLQELSPFRM